MARSELTPAEREALLGLLAAPKLEVLPLQSVRSQLSAVTPGTALAIAASPSKGMDASLRLGEQLRAAGHEVVVHVAAHMVTGREHLQRLLSALASVGIDRIFVVGGDAGQAGPYADALALLRAMGELAYRPREIGIACYPQGHPSIPDERLTTALTEKAPLADYMTSQLCFDAGALRRWVLARRAQGVSLALDIGLPGALDVAHLLRVSTRIGVTDAARYLAHQRGLVGRFLRPGGYRPDSLLREMAPMLADPAAGVRGLHIYTFNQLARTQDWRADFSQSLAKAQGA